MITVPLPLFLILNPFLPAKNKYWWDIYHFACHNKVWLVTHQLIISYVKGFIYSISPFNEKVLENKGWVSSCDVTLCGILIHLNFLLWSIWWSFTFIQLNNWCFSGISLDLVVHSIHNYADHNYNIHPRRTFMFISLFTVVLPQVYYFNAKLQRLHLSAISAKN